MNYSKTCCGMTYFDEKDLEGTTINHRIELEYYKTDRVKESECEYGIEILKKEYINDDIKIESNNIQKISDSSDKVIEIINTLKKHKVTPVGLNDVLEDLLKINHIN